MCVCACACTCSLWLLLYLFLWCSASRFAFCPSPSLCWLACVLVHICRSSPMLHQAVLVPCLGVVGRPLLWVLRGRCACDRRFHKPTPSQHCGRRHPGKTGPGKTQGLSFIIQDLKIGLCFICGVVTIVLAVPGHRRIDNRCRQPLSRLFGDMFFHVFGFWAPNISPFSLNKCILFLTGVTELPCHNF